MIGYRVDGPTALSVTSFRRLVQEPPGSARFRVVRSRFLGSKHALRESAEPYALILSLSSNTKNGDGGHKLGEREPIMETLAHDSSTGAQS
jgi:hypothetical protein